MLGYHDSPKCKTDIWAPQPTMWGDNAIENRAFSPFCVHEIENELIIKSIAAGNTYFDLSDRTTDDLEYIKYQLSKHYGLNVTFENV